MARWRIPAQPTPQPGDVLTVKLNGKAVRLTLGDHGRARVEPAPFKLKPPAKPRKRTKAPAGHRTSYAGMAPLFKACGLPVPVFEHYPLKPRFWRLDVSWPELMIAIEIDGGLFNQGAHTRGAFIMRTHEKLNALAAAGWRMWHYTPQTLKRAPVDMAGALQAAARQLAEHTHGPRVAALLDDIRSLYPPERPP
jgi:hypothetical protein